MIPSRNPEVTPLKSDDRDRYDPNLEKEYHFTSIWTVKGNVDEVLDAIADYEKWSEWWHSVKSIEMIGEGAERRIRSRWAAGLYTLRFDTLNVREVADPARSRRGIVFEASGDLNGIGAIVCMPDDGDPGYTVVEITWDVATSKPWMNKSAKWLRGFFAFNHERIMRQGEEEFGKYLGAIQAERLAS